MPRLVGIALLLVGLIGGTVSDRPRVVEPVEVGPYRVVEGDFHVHTFFGDGALSPINIVLEARRHGLGAIAVTNHNQVFAARLARWFSRRIDGPTVLVGQEITAPAYHLIAAGIERKVSWRQPAEQTIAEVHAQGGVAIAAHPVEAYWPAYTDAVVAELDGAERMHPLVYTAEERREDLPTFYDRARGVNERLAAIGSSDFHAKSLLGVCRTYLFVTEPGEAGVLDAVREGRTVVFDREGRAVGDPVLIDLLRASSFEPDPRNLEGELPSWADLLTRACALLGLVGLVVLRGGHRGERRADAESAVRG